MKKRIAAWRMLAISVLALGFPATALGAETGHAKPKTSASAGAPAPAAHPRLGRPVLGFGSGYGSPGGSEIVRVVQRDLAAGGYLPGPIDGLYGPLTRQAVLWFQAAHELPVDGVVGPHTWAALSEPVLILGLGAGNQPGSGNVVRSLQRRLASAGESPGPIDGHYGVLTEAAVKRFQHVHGLPATGIAGPRLLALVANIKPARHRSGPRGRTLRPATTRSSLRPRPTASPVPPAPRERPTSAARRAFPGSAHRPRPGSLPWMIILGGLALAVAFVLVARFLIASLRHAAPRSEGTLALPEKAGSHGGSAALERTSLTTLNGEHEAVARTNGHQIHTNGHRARAIEAGIGNGADSRLDRGRADDLPGPVETAGAFDLGQQLAGHGGEVQAHAANGHADERGHGIPTSNLGRLLEEQGAPAEAEVASPPADELDDGAGAFRLGLLLESQGRVVEAQAAYGRADKRGHAAAAWNVGRLLEDQGTLAEAEVAYRRADERGNADGAFSLGVLLAGQGALAEAEAAFRRAEERGDARAGSNIGVLLEERGAPAEAEAAYRRADEGGNAAGAFNLGLLLAERGALDEAEAAFRRAEERGDPSAAFNLGLLLEERGAPAEAEASFRRAEHGGDPKVANMARAALLDLP